MVGRRMSFLLVFVLVCHIYGQTYPPDVSLSKVQIPSMTQPAYLVATNEPTFGTKIMRITTTAGLTHYYAKDQPWNCTMTRVKLTRGVLLDKSYKQIGTNVPGDETRWSNLDPDIMFQVTGTTIRKCNISTGNNQTLRTFSGYTSVYLGPWEGNLSKDDKRAVLAGNKGGTLELIVYNIETNTVEATKSMGGSFDDLDWATISQSGNYVICNWNTNGSGTRQGVELYDRNLNFLRQLLVTGEHADAGYDSRGNEVYVSLTCGERSRYNAEIVMVRLDNGELTRIVDGSFGGFGGHVSCRNVKRPGWAYISEANSIYECFAVKLDGSMTVERFAHHHSVASPIGCPSPDGTIILFASDWGGSTYCYVTWKDGPTASKNDCIPMLTPAVHPIYGLHFNKGETGIFVGNGRTLYSLSGRLMHGR